MGFTTPCFICKNTANIRNILKELGYYCNPYLGWHNLFTCVFGINSVYSLDDYDTNGLKVSIHTPTQGVTLYLITYYKSANLIHCYANHHYYSTS